MNCSNCGTQAAPGQKFCANCGTPLANACPNCGAAVVEGQRFCGNCGTALGSAAAVETQATAIAEPISSAAEVSVAERRLVTVLFADLVGFTSIAEGRDHEQVREFQARYFETAREIIVRYRGTVEKFIGDAVMAVWGAPSAHEDDAERAVRAALDLVESVRALGSQTGVDDLQLRAAVVTGEATVTVGAEGQGMVSGDLVNTASRLQSVAPAGGVLVGQATHEAAGQAIAFEEVGEKTLKGKQLPVAAWRAVRVVALRGGVGRYTGLEPPFEGRDDDLRLLKDLFHSTVRERRARLVRIIGQAGTGKSRLIREFEKYIDGIAEQVFWHTGRSPSYGEGITFWALGEMVRKRAGLAERDDDATTREGIATVLNEFVPDEADRRWIEPRLQQLLGVGEARSTQREELFGAWRMFFERVADRGPVVMAFEDLESADSGMLDFIDYMLEWSRNQPILILGLCRPELLERRPGWGAGHRNVTTIGLEPLTDKAMREAVAGLVPGLPESAVTAIVSRAEGVPLYAVETVRMLINEGRLAEHEGVYEPVGDVASLEIPNTLHALIAARLDALEREDRTILQDAAVLGNTFSTAAVAAVSGAPASELEARLRSLVRREVLELNVDPRSPERGQYGFVQGLVREVAYSTLSKRDRRARHLAAARYFETLGDEELAGVLATHYLDAWKAAPEGPEGAAIAAQARVALRAAAERASALHSPAQALSFLEHLLAVTTDPAERASALERAAANAELAARFEDVRRYAVSALADYRELGQAGGVGRAAGLLARSYLGSADIDHGIEVAEEVLAEVQGQAGDPGVVELIGTLARLHALRGDNEEAIALADRALVEAERLDLVEIICGAVMTKATSLAYLHRMRESMILMPGALLLAETNGLIVIEARARLNMSQFIMTDEPATALSIARLGLERAQKFGLRQWENLLAGNVVMAALHSGDWDDAIAISHDVLRDSPISAQNNEADCYPAIMAGLRGDGGQWLARHIAAYEPIANTTSNPQYAALLRVLHGWQALIQGDLRRTADDVDEDPTVEPTYGASMYWLAGHAALWLRDRERAERLMALMEALAVRGLWSTASMRGMDAGITALAGRTAEANAAFSDAGRTLRELGLPLDTALLLMDQVAVVGAADPAGHAAVDEAREILTRLGASVLLGRLDALTGEAGSTMRVEAAAETAASTEVVG